MDIKLHNLGSLLLCYAFASLLGLFLSVFELDFVDAQSQFLCHETSKVNGEPKCIIQPPDIFSIELFDVFLGCARGELVEKFFSSVESARKRFFFLVENFFDVIELFRDLWEDITL